MFQQLAWRVLLVGGLAVIAVPTAKLFGGFIPDGISEKIGAEAVDALLTIIASSMLAVTTFSLSVMVSVYRSVASQWTPRAHRIQLKDTRTQTVLATFVGAYIYALLSIILLHTPFFTEGEIVVLFAMTIVVIVMIVATILRWVLHLQTFGSLEQTANTIRDDTVRALHECLSNPALSANPLTPDVIIPADAVTVRASRSGYIVRILVHALQNAATDCHGYIWLTVKPGDYVNEGEVIAHISGDSDAMEQAIKRHIDIGLHRDIPQDPEIGMVMLSEIGVKAMSPGVNDPGTAIWMMDRIMSVVYETPKQETPTCDRVWMPVFELHRAFYTSVDLLARYSAGAVEVQQAMFKRLDGVAHCDNPALAATARELGARLYARGQQSLPTDVDKQDIYKPDWI